MKICMIEDDETISFAVKSYLEKQEMTVTCFQTLESTADIDLDFYDLILLDINLPDGSGFEFLTYIRSFSSIPAILLTVKDEEAYVLKGFGGGADDYITKPFSLPVLKARIDNVMRRKTSINKELTFEELSLSPETQTAQMGGKNLDLSRQEFGILEMLIENQGQNILREQLLERIWGEENEEIHDNTLSVCIKRLRKKLGEYGDCIKTIRGIGYRWEGEIE